MNRLCLALLLPFSMSLASCVCPTPRDAWRAAELYCEARGLDLVSIRWQFRRPCFVIAHPTCGNRDTFGEVAEGELPY